MFRGALRVEVIFFLCSHLSLRMASWSKFRELQLSNNMGGEGVRTSVGKTW